MNRPRDSVLNLFDPLNTPPRRDVPSPDSGSDKENSSPGENNAITMTAFFGRTYTRQKNASPVVMRKRLVDVGDVTVADASLARVVDEDEDGDDGLDSEGNESLLDESLDDGEDEDEDLTILGPWKASRSDEDYRQSDSTRSPTSPRLPLREIMLEVTPTANKGLSKHPDTLSKMTSAQPVSRVPADSPFAAVINGINFPSESGSPNVVPAVVYTVEEPAEADAQALGSSTAGLIPSPERALITKTLSPPSPILSNPVLPPEISTVHLRPPHNATTNSLDPRRTSVDLHASFNLQLQCPETSFDLLNDRISFFGQETFLNGIDDDFDLEAEEAMMEALAHKVEEKIKVSVAEDTALCSQFESKVDEINTTNKSPQENISPVLIHTPQLHKNVSKKSSEETSSPTVLSKPAFSRIPSPPPPSLPSPPKPTERAVPIKADVLPETPERLTASMKTTLAPAVPPVPPVPVPALRIIKRTKLYERKMSTTTTVPTSVAPAPLSRRRSSVVPVPPPAPVPRHRPMLQGVQRPPAGVLVPTTKPPVSLASQKRLAAASSLGKETGGVLQRLEAAAAMPSSKSMPVVTEKAKAASASGSGKIAGGTSRLPVVGAGQTKIATGAGGVSALRQPTRYGSGSVDGGSPGASAGFLPRPASSLSRLQGSRLKAPSVGTVFGNGTVGRAATSRRV